MLTYLHLSVVLNIALRILNNEISFDKNIGLLYLYKSIKFSNYEGTIVPVCLPTEHLKYYNMEATVAGWGIHVRHALLPEICLLTVNNNTLFALLFVCFLYIFSRNMKVGMMPIFRRCLKLS